MFRIILILMMLVSREPANAQVPGVEHVIIIGCDGMSPDGVRQAKAPHMKRMMKEGAWTLKARGVMPTSSSPNWASMIMGAGPEQHGVTSNDWQTNRCEIEPVARGREGMFPTIFGTIREQRPEAIIGCFYDWDDFGRLLERSAVDFMEDSAGPTNAALHAIEFIRARKPTFTFIHLDHVDHAGHDLGHGTPEYYESVDVADKLIGNVLTALESAGMMERSVVLVTSDHGGVGKSHGKATMAEIEIPWIIFGRGVKRGHEIQTPVNTCDTALTVAHLLGVKPHPATIGKPVKEAFAE